MPEISFTPFEPIEPNDDLLNVICGTCGSTYGAHGGLECPGQSNFPGRRFVVSAFTDDRSSTRPFRASPEYNRLEDRFRAIYGEEYGLAPRIRPSDEALQRRLSTPSRIMGYAYDAAEHCISCTNAAHSYNGTGMRTHESDPMLDINGIADDATDSEGNAIHPIFRSDDWCDGGGEDSPGCAQSCHECGNIMQEHSPVFHGYCGCGDGCPDGECEACDTVSYDDSADYDQQDDCDCKGCIAASEYQPGVE